jgi:F0F1-type ATP synthase membrane subunit b/b'
MDKTLHDLGAIVLNALPTFVLVVVLAFFVKRLYLDPLEKVLAERYNLTDGARKKADESFRDASARIGQYEAELSRARAEIYREQAEFLRKVHEEQGDLVRAARAESEQLVSAVKLSLAWESTVAIEALAAQSDMLAGQIVEAVLQTRAS